MTIVNPIETARRASPQGTTGPQIALAASIAVAVAFAATVQHAMPREALLPSICTLLFVLAATVALVAWRRPVPRQQLTYWDAAGLLTLIGVLATAMVEPGEMVHLVAGAERHN